MRRILILSSLALLSAILVIFGQMYTSIDRYIGQTETPAPQTLGEHTDNNEVIPFATLKIEADEGIDSSYLLSVDEDTTAYTLLQKASETGDIEMETQKYDFGVFVNSINGFDSTEEKSWIYFVNGESGQIAADQMKVSAGDYVEWRYIAPGE
jgi:hypothetical protein